MAAEIQSNKICDVLNSFISNKNTIQENKKITKFNSDSCLLVKNKTLPTCQQDFQSRLSTFEFGLWTSTRISPLTCARYGWHLKEKDLLKCSTCSALLCANLPSPTQNEAYDTFFSLLQEQLIAGHKDWCGWPSNPSPETFLHPPSELTLPYLRNMRNQIIKICCVGKSLPYLDVSKCLEKLDLQKTDLSILSSPEIETNEFKETAALLILFGWSFETTNKLRCDICLRVIGMWNYISISKYPDLLHLEESCVSRREAREIREADFNARREARMERKSAEALRCKEDAQARKRRRLVRDALRKIERLQRNEELEEDQRECKEPPSAEEELNLLEGKEIEKGNESMSDESEEESEQMDEEETNEREENDDMCSDKEGEEDGDKEKENQDNLEENDEASVDYENKTDVSNESEEINDEKKESEEECDTNIEEPKDDDTNKTQIEDQSPNENIEESLNINTNDNIDSDKASDNCPVNRKRKRSGDEDSETNEGEGRESDSEEELEEHPSDDEEKDELKKLRSDLFCPLSEHRHWCGWASSDIGRLYLKAPPSLSGRAVISILPPQLKLVKPVDGLDQLASSDKYSRNVEGLRVVRGIVDSWSLDNYMEEQIQEDSTNN